MTKVIMFTSDRGDVPVDMAFKNNYSASGAPGADDDSAHGYAVGSIWTDGSQAFVCVDATEGAAVWVQVGTTSSFVTETVETGITASTTQTQGGGTPLTEQVNIVSTVANASDAVTLASLGVGEHQDVYNAGANAAKVFPASGYTIDGGSANASVTLTNAKRCRYTCVAADTIVSAQLGVPSA